MDNRIYRVHGYQDIQGIWISGYIGSMDIRIYRVQGYQDKQGTWISGYTGAHGLSG